MQADNKIKNNVYLDSTAPPKSSLSRFVSRLDEGARYVLLIPGIAVVLVMAIFPLLVSLYLSFSRFNFVKGGFQINFIGFTNYNKLLFGSEQRHFLGKLGTLPITTGILLAVFIGFLLYMLYSYIRSPKLTVFGLIMRIITVVATSALAYLIAATLNGEGLPGTLVVTLLFVLGGVTCQYLIGLGLAMLLVQNLPVKRFFRVIFLLPMMITPVGIGFLFKMVTDTGKGPLSPLWQAVGLGGMSWLGQADSARLAVVIGDTWQWTPFMFIILLAALEGVSRETIEAALVDGATGIQLFRYITLPEIIPVSATVILIRMIEAFKIIDMPNILTGGGPGTATETLTLQSYVSWRSSDLGGSAALSYLLLIIVTFTATVFVNFVRRRLLEAFA